jgi:hypothetical protein
VSEFLRKGHYVRAGEVVVLPGTVEACGGPHPSKFHLDEVELMDPKIWEEAKRAVESPGSPG